MKYFTADWHILHDNNRGSGIIQYCNRPFSDVKKMGHTIIGNYNSVVTDKDEAYFLGDFSLTKDKYYLERIVPNLRGTKYLILGNHDYLKPFEYEEIGFVSVHTSLEVDGMILVHDPAKSYKNRSKWFLCGHVHDLFKIFKNCYNVGVDSHNFYPVSSDQVMEDIKSYAS